MITTTGQSFGGGHINVHFEIDLDVRAKIHFGEYKSFPVEEAAIVFQAILGGYIIVIGEKSTTKRCKNNDGVVLDGWTNSIKERPIFKDEAVIGVYCKTKAEGMFRVKIDFVSIRKNLDKKFENRPENYNPEVIWVK